MFHPSSSSQPAEVFRKDLISAMKLPDSHQLSPENYWVIQDQWKQEWEKGVQVPVDDTSINDPQFFEVRMKDDSGAFELPDEFIKCYSGSEEQMQQAEDRQKEIEATCQYDLDEVDIQWLHIVNREREDMGDAPIDELTMEKIIEQCEIQCQKNIEHAIQTEEGLGIEYDEDICCAVCRAPDSEEGNEMVFCDKCDICVHQACYGVLKIPEGSWMCRVCALGLQPECMLCGKKGGAMKSTRSGTKWAHVNCALWIPEVSIGDVDRMEPITKIAQIPASRWSLICNLCRERQGACIQCSVKSCKIAYHVTCAVEHTLEMEQNLDENKEVKFKSFCLKHTNSRKGSSSSSSSDAPARHTSRKKSSEEERANDRAMRIQRVTEEFQKYVRKKEVVNNFKDDAEVVHLVFEYWKLKRKSGFNKPLLNFAREDDKDKNSEEYNLHARMKMFVHLRQDLERVRNLCYMVQKREKLSRQMMRLREGLFKKQCEFFNGNLTRMTEEEVDWAARAGEISARVPYPMSEDVILNKWLSIPSDGPKMLFDDEDDTTEEDSEVEMEAKKERDKKKREKAAERKKKEAEATARLKEKLAKVKGPVSSNTRGVKHRRISSMDGKEIYEDEIRSRKGGTPSSRLSDSSQSPSSDKEMVNGEVSREATPERSGENPQKLTAANKKREVEHLEKHSSKHAKENTNNLKRAKEKSSSKESQSSRREKSSEQESRKTDEKANKLKEKQITRDDHEHDGERRKTDSKKEKLNSVHNHRMNHKAPVKRKTIANNNPERDLKHSITKKERKFFKSPNSKQKTPLANKRRRSSNSDENSINNHIITEEDKVHFLGQGLEVKEEWTYWQTSDQRKVQSEKEVRHDEDKNAAEFLLMELGDKAQLPLTPFDHANAKPESQDFVQRHSEDQNAADFLSFEKIDGKTSNKDLRNESTPLSSGMGKQRHKAAGSSQDSFRKKNSDRQRKDTLNPTSEKPKKKKHLSGTSSAAKEDSSIQKGTDTQELKKGKSKSSRKENNSGTRKEHDQQNEDKSKDNSHKVLNRSDSKGKTQQSVKGKSKQHKDRTLVNHDRQNSHPSQPSGHLTIHQDKGKRDKHGKDVSGKHKDKHLLKYPDHSTDEATTSKNHGKQDRKSKDSESDPHRIKENGKFKSPKNVDYNRSTETESRRHSPPGQGRRKINPASEEQTEGVKKSSYKSMIKSPAERRPSVEGVSGHGKDKKGSSEKSAAHDKDKIRSPSASHDRAEKRLKKSKSVQERSHDRDTVKSPSGRNQADTATSHEKGKQIVALDSHHESCHAESSELVGQKKCDDKSRIGRRPSSEGVYSWDRTKGKSHQKSQDSRPDVSREDALVQKKTTSDERRRKKSGSTEQSSLRSDSSRDREMRERPHSSTKQVNAVGSESSRMPHLPSGDRGRSPGRTSLSSSQELSVEGSGNKSSRSSSPSSDIRDNIRQHDSEGASPSKRQNRPKDKRTWNHSTDTADDSSSVEQDASGFQDTDVTQSDKDTDPAASIFDLAPDEKPFQPGIRHSSRRVSSASSDHGSQADAELSDDTDTVSPPRTKRRRKSAASIRNNSLARNSRKSTSLLGRSASRRGSLSSDRSSVVSVDDLVEREPPRFNKSLDRPPTPTLARGVPAGRDEGKFVREREVVCRRLGKSKEDLWDDASSDQRVSEKVEVLQKNEIEGRHKGGDQLKTVTKEKERLRQPSGDDSRSERISMTTRTRSVNRDIDKPANAAKIHDAPHTAPELEKTLVAPPQDVVPRLLGASNTQNGEVSCFDSTDLDIPLAVSGPQQRVPLSQADSPTAGIQGPSGKFMPPPEMDVDKRPLLEGPKAADLVQLSQRENPVAAQGYLAFAERIATETSHLGSQETFNRNLESLSGGRAVALSTADQAPKQPPSILHRSGIPVSLWEPGNPDATKVTQSTPPRPLSDDMPPLGLPEGIRLDELWANQKSALERIAEMVPDESLTNLDLLPPVLEPSVSSLIEPDVNSLFSLGQDIVDPEFLDVPPDVRGIVEMPNHSLDGKDLGKSQMIDTSIALFPEWKEIPDGLMTNKTPHSVTEIAQPIPLFQAEFATMPITAKSSEAGLYGLNASLNRTLFPEANDEKTDSTCIDKVIKNHLTAPHEIRSDLFPEKHPLTMPPSSQQQPKKVIHWGLDEPTEITASKNISTRRKSAPGMVPEQSTDPISLQHTLRRNNSMLNFQPPSSQVNYPVNNMAMFSSLLPKGTQGSLWDMTPKDTILPARDVNMWESPAGKEGRAPQGNGWDIPPLLANKQLLDSISLAGGKSGTTVHPTRDTFSAKNTDASNAFTARTSEPASHKSGGSWRDILDNMPNERERAEFGWNPVDLPEFVPPPPPTLVPSLRQFNSFVGKSSGFHPNLSESAQKGKPPAIPEEVSVEEEPPSSKKSTQDELSSVEPEVSKEMEEQPTESGQVPDTSTALLPAPNAVVEKEPEQMSANSTKTNLAPENGIYFHKKLSSQRRREVRCNPLIEPSDSSGKTIEPSSQVGSTVLSTGRPASDAVKGKNQEARPPTSVRKPPSTSSAPSKKGKSSNVTRRPSPEKASEDSTAKSEGLRSSRRLRGRKKDDTSDSQCKASKEAGKVDQNKNITTRRRNATGRNDAQKTSGEAEAAALESPAKANNVEGSRVQSTRRRRSVGDRAARKSCETDAAKSENPPLRQSSRRRTSVAGRAARGADEKTEIVHSESTKLKEAEYVESESTELEKAGNVVSESTKLGKAGNVELESTKLEKAGNVVSESTKLEKAGNVVSESTKLEKAGNVVSESTILEKAENVESESSKLEKAGHVESESTKSERAAEPNDEGDTLGKCESFKETNACITRDEGKTDKAAIMKTWDDTLPHTTGKASVVSDKETGEILGEAKPVGSEEAAMLNTEESDTLGNLHPDLSTLNDKSEEVSEATAVMDQKVEAKLNSPSKVLPARRNKFNSSLSVLSSKKEDLDPKVNAKRQLLAKEFNKHIRGTPLRHGKESPRKRIGPPGKKRPLSSLRRTKRPKTETPAIPDTKERGGVFDFTSDEEAEDSVPIILPISPRVLLTDVGKKLNVREVLARNDMKDSSPVVAPIGGSAPVDLSSSVDDVQGDPDSDLSKKASTPEDHGKEQLTVNGPTGVEESSSRGKGSVARGSREKPVMKQAPMTSVKVTQRRKILQLQSSETEEITGDRRRSSRVLAMEKEEAKAKAEEEETNEQGPLNERRASLRTRRKDSQQTNNDGDSEDGAEEESVLSQATEMDNVAHNTLGEMRMENVAEGEKDSHSHDGDKRTSESDKVISQEQQVSLTTLVMVDTELAEGEEEPLAMLKAKLTTHTASEEPSEKSAEGNNTTVAGLVNQTSTKIPSDLPSDAKVHDTTGEALTDRKKSQSLTDLKIEGANGKLVIRNWKQFAALKKRKKKKKKKKLALREAYRAVRVSESQDGPKNGLKLRITTLDRYFKPVPPPLIDSTATPSADKHRPSPEEKPKAHTPIKLRIAKSLISPYRPAKYKLAKEKGTSIDDEHGKSNTDAETSDGQLLDGVATLDGQIAERATTLEGMTSDGSTTQDRKIPDVTATLDETILADNPQAVEPRNENLLEEKTILDESPEDDDEPLVVMKDRIHQSDEKQLPAKVEENPDDSKLPVTESIGMVDVDRMLLTKPEEMRAQNCRVSGKENADSKLLDNPGKTILGLKGGSIHKSGESKLEESRQENKEKPLTVVEERLEPPAAIGKEILPLVTFARTPTKPPTKKSRIVAEPKKAASMDVFDFDLEDEPPKVFPSPTIRSKVRRSLDTSTSSAVESSPFEGPSPADSRGKRERRLVDYFEGSDQSDNDSAGGARERHQQQSHKRLKPSSDLAPPSRCTPQGSDKLEFLESMGT